MLRIAMIIAFATALLACASKQPAPAPEPVAVTRPAPPPARPQPAPRPAPPPVAVVQPELPKTASPLPGVALAGVTALGVAAALRIARRRP
ncbi:MAG: hypothetical protein OEY15_15100 [Myxococcales bacterium]|nr:hypothetical protein [Myxococcales bacterium]